MEHEDIAHLDNYLQSSQHLMDNLQMASGGGVRADVGGLVGSEEIGLGIGNIGGKFEEHEEQDDVDEWKYIKEEQQSEKQQTLKDAGDDVPAAEVGNSNNQSNSNGNGNGNIDAGDELLLLGRHEHEAGDGFGNVAVDAFGAVDGFGVGVGVDGGVAVDEETEVEIIKKDDGDFSTTSNTTSTPGDEDADADVAANAGVLQVEMKIESAETMPHMPAAEMEEEEPSSLATNTTNGTNSLSENLPPHHEEHEYHGHQQQQQQQQHDFDMDMENKENADPLMVQNHAAPTHEMELNFEMHSQLNPDAREFVPNFGSNPASPTLPVSDSAFDDVGELTFEPVQQAEPHPVDMARHLLGEAAHDDFVAQSPRKGSGEANMDMDIALPPENEFEHEAAKRPHELEDDDLIGEGVEQLTEPVKVDLLGVDIMPVGGEDANDFQRHSPASFIDHGPETSVDLDADIDEQVSEVMRQTEKAGESIEQLLNTVQPLPTDTESLNASFADEAQQEQEPESEPVVGEKEHLDVDEKEHISHSPSTEEMQMNFQNELHASAKDIPQIPADLDNAEHMQESIYLEHTSSEAQQQQQPELTSPVAQSPQPQLADESLLMNTSNPLDSDISFEAMRAAPADIEGDADDVATHPQTPLNIFAPEFMPTQKFAGDDASPSPQSTEEKHLVEETKEEVQNAAFNITGGLDGLVQGMDDMVLSAKDEILSQAEEFAQAAANVIQNLNPFAVDVDNEPTPTPAEFMPEPSEFEPQGIESSVAVDDKPVIPEPELVACQYTALSEQVAEAVKTAAEPVFDAFAPATPTNISEPELASEAIVEPTLVAEEAVIAAAEPPAAIPAEVAAPAEVEAPAEVTAPVEVTTPADDLVAFASEPAAVEPTPAAVLPEAEKPVEEVEESKAAIAAVAATAAVAAGATAAAVAAVAKKTDAAKPKPASRTPTSAKPKVGDVKKTPTATSAKKPIGAATATKTSTTTTTAAARPRTAPSLKPTTAAAGEKKASPTTRPTTTTTAARKPLTATGSTTKTTTARTTTSARPATAPAAAKSAAPAKPTTATRTTTTTLTARRTGPSATSPSSNGTAAKPRTTASAPTKPTSLGLSGSTAAAAKPKMSSPRAALTVRKIAPAKSPVKSTAPTTNGTHVSATKSSTLTASGRPKTTSVTTTTTTTTKTFTARPAPKTTHTSTTTTRRTIGGVPSSSATTGTTKTSSTLLKRSPPAKTAGGTTTTGRLSSPSKAPTTALKTKTKEAATKKAATPTKPAPIKRKQPEEVKTNGNDAAQDEHQLQQPQLNGGGDQPMENGVHNGGEQQQQQHQNGSGLEHELQQQAPVELSLMDA